MAHTPTTLHLKVDADATAAVELAPRLKAVILDLVTAMASVDPALLDKDALADATVSTIFAEILRVRQATPAEAAIARVRRLCELTIAASVRVDAVNQARDTLAALDDSADTASGIRADENGPNSPLHGLIRKAIHDADDHSCQEQEGVDYDRLTDAALAAIRPLGKFLGDMHRDAETDLARVIGLYEQWVQAGAPPLGVSINRWWDRRLIELRNAIVEPAERPREQQ